MDQENSGLDRTSTNKFRKPRTGSDQAVRGSMLTLLALFLIFCCDCSETSTSCGTRDNIPE